MVWSETCLFLSGESCSTNNDKHLNIVPSRFWLNLEFGNSIGQVVIQLKEVQTSPTRLGVRAFQSCQGVWHYLWVFRVTFFWALLRIYIYIYIYTPGSPMIPQTFPYYFFCYPHQAGPKPYILPKDTQNPLNSPRPSLANPHYPHQTCPKPYVLATLGPKGTPPGSLRIQGTFQCKLPHYPQLADQKPYILAILGPKGTFKKKIFHHPRPILGTQSLTKGLQDHQKWVFCDGADRQTHRRTWRLYDQPSPAGQVGK